MTPVERNVALDAAKWASARAACGVHGEMKRGLSSVASIAGTASFVGVLGWILGVYNSFPGGEGEKSAMLALANERLSEALMPLALGLLVALLAYFVHKYLLLRVADFDLEMENAILQVLNQLGSTNI